MIYLNLNHLNLELLIGKIPEAHANEATTGFVAQEVESIDSDWAYEIPWNDGKLNNNEPKDR
jgi:hypothetical protein